MARPLLRLLSQRLGGSNQKFGSSVPSIRQPFQVRSLKQRWPSQRTYATGSGPKTKPGQSPFKVWPFVAITLAGTGAYVLMVRSRAGMSIVSFITLRRATRAPCRNKKFESRFKHPAVVASSISRIPSRSSKPLHQTFRSHIYQNPIH